MKRLSVFVSCVFVLVIWSCHVNAENFSLGDITWEKTKQELRRFDDWSLGVRRIPKGAKPEIIVNDGEVLFNGRVLKFGDDIEVWKKVVGGNPREMMRQRLYIWDDLGLKVAIGWNGSTKVEFFKIFFNCREIDSSQLCPESGGEGDESDPRYMFTGYLEFEGGPIDSKSTVEEANRLISARAKYHRGCGIGLCSGVEGRYGYILSEVVVDGRGYKSIVYGVSFENDVFAESNRLAVDASEKIQRADHFQLNSITWDSTKQIVKDWGNWALGLQVITRDSDSEVVVKGSDNKQSPGHP